MIFEKRLWDNDAEWRMEPNLPVGVNNLTAQAVGKKIYTMGGRTNAVVTGSVAIYDTNVKTWVVGKSMPTARRFLSSSVVGDKIYVIGGTTEDSISITAL